jgi:glutamyl/glutaminyl-tRNA synthetase
VGGPHAPYTQSERLPIYQKHAEELVEKGKAYYCFCTKERLQQVRDAALAKKELPRYDKQCRNLSVDEVQIGAKNRRG